jgi:hypothetical protein
VGLRSDVFILKALGLVAVGAGNATPVFDVGSYEVGGLFLNITAKTGTFTSYLFALQVSMDGSTFSGIGTQAAPLATPGTALSGAVDIPTGAYWLPVNSFAGPYVRLAWVTAAGTNVTFSATLAVRR